jgi:alanyl-tRNA synthetase
MPTLSRVAVEIMGNAYPDLRANADFVHDVLEREEERFRRTLTTGLAILENDLSSGVALPGSSAFLLHDTYGFPLELTQEIAQERGVDVDTAGFEEAMQGQRTRARDARKTGSVDGNRIDLHRSLMERHGTTDFVGYSHGQAEATILAIVDTEDGLLEVFLDRTPFYAESGGQVGDTGSIAGDGFELAVTDTTFALPGLRRHLCRIVSGEPFEGAPVLATIDVAARDATRRNHTGTHILHWALREVLGDHVKQAGSLVAPDRLRFDFSHYEALTVEEIERIESLANGQVLANSGVDAFETSKEEALSQGAIAFFGDKYGDTVRVLRAGASFELCGGTHVRATGDIGTIKILSESSIGSNLRRIEAVTGEHSVRHMQRLHATLESVAESVGARTEDVVAGVQRRLGELRTLQEELREMRSRLASGRAAEMAAAATDGVVVERVDGLEPDDIRELAVAVRQQPGVRVAIIGGVTTSGGVSLAAAVSGAAGVSAGALLKDAARAVGGGGGGKGDVATAGGKDPSGLDEALRIARIAAG